jgi:glutathione synthase/RimK-type ligase-like ATP-grasp enzyme
VPIPLHLERAAIGVARACGLRIAGIDFLIDHDSYRVCEINSSPGFHGLENATKRNIAAAVSSRATERAR